MFDISVLYKPETVDEALKILNEDEASMIISGGTDVLIKLREGKFEDAHLVSIHEMKELNFVKRLDDGTFSIGSAASFTKIEKDPLINECVPLLGIAAAQVGGPQIRNAGTIGGNICNGATSADTATALLTFNAALRLRGFDGERTVPIREFYTGPGKTVRRRDEILTEILISPEDYEGFTGYYIKYAMRNAMDIATLACSAAVKLSDDKKTIEEARLAFGVAAPTPVRATGAEAFLKGKPASVETLDMVKEKVMADLNPRTSWRASKEFREQLIKENSKRALYRAICMGGGNPDA